MFLFVLQLNLKYIIAWVIFSLCVNSTVKIERKNDIDYE